MLSWLNMWGHYRPSAQARAIWLNSRNALAPAQKWVRLTQLTMHFLAGRDKLGAWEFELKAAPLETAEFIFNEVHGKENLEIWIDSSCLSKETRHSQEMRCKQAKLPLRKTSDSIDLKTCCTDHLCPECVDIAQVASLLRQALGSVFAAANSLVAGSKAGKYCILHLKSMFLLRMLYLPLPTEMNTGHGFNVYVCFVDLVQCKPAALPSSHFRERLLPSHLVVCTFKET